MERLGQYLRENREAKGITLEEIEAVSNICIAHLHALEQGQFHLLPAPTFTVGFLKQYARCIGLDPEDVILRYRTAMQQDGRRMQERSLERTGKGARRSVWILGASVLLLGALWMVLYPGIDRTGERVRTIRMPRSSPKEIKKEKLKKQLGLLGEPAPNGVLQTGDVGGPGGSPGNGGETRQNLTKTGAIEVILQALEETKVQISLDDEPEYEAVLKPGDRHAYRAKETVKLQIGNGSGVRIFYNGKVYENLGKKGEVVHIRFPPSEDD